MNYREYVARVSFRLYQPESRLRFYAPLAGLLAKFGGSLEIVNTRLPDSDGDTPRQLRELCAIPRMSTYAVAAMINRAVREMRPEHCFVNVGVWNGFTLLAGMAGNADKKCIGVDNFSEFGGPREQFLERFGRYKSPQHSFHDMDYREYFAKVHKDPIGFYIYDGEHSYENQLMGMQAAEPFFTDDCLILVDDTNFNAARWACFDFVAQSAHDYEILLDRRTSRNEHPTLWNGVMILRRKG